MEALSRLAEAGRTAAQHEAVLREAEAAAEASVASAWTILPDVRSAAGLCNCGEEVHATATGETVRWEERPLAAQGLAVCNLLIPWLSSVASLHRARFALLDAARRAPDAPLNLLLEPFFSSLRAAQTAQPPVPLPALQALQTCILLLALRVMSPEPNAQPVLFSRDVSVYLLDRLLTVRGLQWGKALLQPPTSSARTVLAFAARVLDEAGPAESEAEALIALSQCAWHDAAKHTNGEEEACLVALSTLLTRALTLGWLRVYAALAHFASMLAREAPFYTALPFLTASVCSDRRSRTLASPVLPLFAFHEIKHPSAMVVCFARLYGLVLSPEEEIVDETSEAMALLLSIGTVTSQRRREARGAIIDELVNAEAGALGHIYRAASPEAAALHQSAQRPNDSALVRSHVPRLPLLHALFRLARAAATAAETAEEQFKNSYVMLTKLITEELALLSSLALRPPERTALMQSEAGIYAEALCAATPQWCVPAVIGAMGRMLPELGNPRESLFGPSALFAWTPDFASINWIAYLLVHRTFDILPDPSPAEPTPTMAEKWLLLAASPPAQFPAPLAPLAASIALRIICSGANWPRASPILRCLALCIVVAAPVTGLNPTLLAEQLLCVGSGLHRLLATPLPSAFLNAFLRRSDIWFTALPLTNSPPGLPDHPLYTSARDLYELCQAVVALSAGAEPPSLAALATRPHIPSAAFISYLLEVDALRPDVIASVLSLPCAPVHTPSAGSLNLPPMPDVLPSIVAALYSVLSAHPQLWQRVGSSLSTHPESARLRVVLSHLALAALLTSPNSNFLALIAGVRSAAPVSANRPDFASVAAIAASSPNSARPWLSLAQLMIGQSISVQSAAAALVPLRFFFLILWEDASLRSAMQREQHEWLTRIAASLAPLSLELSHTYRALSLFAQPICPGNGDLLQHPPLVAMLRAHSPIGDQLSTLSSANSTPSLSVLRSSMSSSIPVLPQSPPQEGAGSLVLPVPVSASVPEDLAAELNRYTAATALSNAALSQAEDPNASQQRLSAMLAICRQTSAHLLAAHQQEEERTGAVTNLYVLEESREEKRVKCPKGDCTGARLFIPRLRPVQRPAAAHLLNAFRPARVRLLAMCASAAEAVASALTTEEALIKALAPSSKPSRVAALEAAILRLVDCSLSPDAGPFRMLISALTTESAALPLPSSSAGFHSALWSKLLSSQWSEARAGLLQIVQPSLFLQGAPSLLLDFADADARHKRAEQYREAAEQAAQAASLRPDERVLLLSRFDWSAYLSSGGAASSLRPLVSVLLSDASLHTALAPLVSALFANAQLELRLELLRGLLTAPAVISGDLTLASLIISPTLQLSPQDTEAYYVTASAADPLAALRLPLILPYLPHPSLCVYLEPLVRRLPSGVRSRAAAECLGALLARAGADEALSCLLQSALPWLVRTGDASLASLIATPLRSLDWSHAASPLANPASLSALMLSPLAQFALEVLCLLRWPAGWTPPAEKENYAVDLLYLCAEAHVLDDNIKLPNVDERENPESAQEAANIQTQAMRAVRWADDPNWKSEIAATRMAATGGGGLWRQVSSGRAIAGSVPLALHLLLHATPLLAPGRLLAYASVLRFAARVAYLALMEPGGLVPAWRLSHVQQVEVLSHMARLMQGLSARAAEQLDVMPTLASLWAEVYDKGLDLVQTVDRVERRASDPPDGTLPNEKIRALLAHMASTLPAPVVLALIPHSGRTPQWLEELTRAYFIWESEEPPRLSALIGALPPRLALPGLDISHAYPLLLSALLRRAFANAASLGAAEFLAESEKWFSIAIKCEPPGHYQLHLVPLWTAVLTIYADARTPAGTYPLLVRLFERHAPPKASLFTRLTTEDQPASPPLYLAARSCLVYLARLTAQKRARTRPEVKESGAEEQQHLERLLALRSEHPRYQSFFTEAESFLSPLSDLHFFAATLCNTLFPYAPYLLYASSTIVTPP